MTPQELVSVVVPVFNRERFLRAAIESIVAQDYEPLEIIVVDDGSTDGSAVIARSFPEVRYRFQENAGVSAARNTGITMARGSFLSFFDADDLMLPHKISAQVRYLEAHDDIECVLARHDVLVDDGFVPPRLLNRDPVYGDVDGVQLESVVIRRSALERVGGFDPSYRYGEGLEWLARVRGAGVGIAVLDQVVARRRIHAGNASHDRPATKHAFARALKEKIARGRPERAQDESAP